MLRHELKSPLVPVKGYADMMLRGLAGEVTPKMASYLERIGAAATPPTYAPDLEHAWLPDAAEIASALRNLACV